MTREEAIKDIEENILPIVGGKSLRMAIDALRQPERKTGKWLPDNNSLYEMRFVCSECHESEVVPTIGFTKYKPIWGFCPNCGADMTEGEG